MAVLITYVCANKTDSLFFSYVGHVATWDTQIEDIIYLILASLEKEKYLILGHANPTTHKIIFARRYYLHSTSP